MSFGRKKRNGLLDTASEIAEQVRDEIGSVMDTAKDKAAPLLADAREKAGPVVADARERAAEKAAEARAKAGPAIADAREKAAPVVADARERAAEKAAEAREKAAPVIAEGRKRAARKAALERERARVKVAAFRDAAPGERLSAARDTEPSSKGGKLKKLFLLGALVAIGGAVFKKLRGNPAQSNWQSSYTPAPAPAAAGSPIASAPAVDSDAASDDAAGSSPDERLADEAAEPHPDTTPDAPAEVVDLPVGDQAGEAAAATGSAPQAGTGDDVEYGEGAARSNPGGAAPDSSYTIKGNVGSKLFHTPDSPHYGRTVAEVWFRDEDAAVAHGFTRWDQKD